MKKFRFKLQTVLDQRQAKEDQRLAELGELRQEEAREMERLVELHQRLQDAFASIELALQQNASPEDIARRQDYAEVTVEDIKLQELIIEGVRNRVEVKRVELVDAMKDRKVLETLRDKQEHEYIAAFEKAEQDMLDEMASVRYARGM